MGVKCTKVLGEEYRVVMKINKSVFLFLAVVMLISLMAGCSGSKGPLDGEWAYIHDTDKAALVIESGKATLDGVKYGCTYDDAFITLTDSQSNVKKLRYVVTEKGILLYKSTDYVRSGEGSSSDVVGEWKDTPDNWSYEFTAEGTFVEDGFFSGTYEVNEADGTVTLTYGGDMDETVIYYSVSGDTLTIEYPWPMVKIK